MKKYLYIILLIVIIPLLGIAQNDTLIINNNYKWKIGVKALVEKGNYKLPLTSNLQVDVPSDKLLYNFGIQGIYKFGNTRSSGEFGVYYLSRAFYYEFLLPTNTSTLVDFFSRVTYNNLHIPLNYRFDNHVFYFTIGGYMDYLLNMTTKNSELFNNNLPEGRKFNVGLNGSVGIEKSISSLFSVFVEGEFSSNLTPINDRSNYHLTNYGMAIGFNYKIVKQ